MRGKKRVLKMKKGFTLIEVAAVLGIIMALMVFFVPRVSAYVKDSKIAGVMAEARQVIFAWETVNSRSNSFLEKDTTVTTLKGKESEYPGYFELAAVKSIPDEGTVEQCFQLVDGATFNFGEDGKVVLNTIEKPSKPSE